MPTPKKIAINTRLLLPNKMEGIARFTLEILRLWVQKWPDCTFYFLFDRKPDPQFILSKNVVPVVINPQARHPFLYYLYFHVATKKWLNKNKVDFYFSPEGYLPLNCSTPCFNTVHDLNYHHFPQHLPALERWFYKRFFPKYIRFSQHCFTVSNFSKQDLINTYSIEPQKITCIHNASNLEQHKPSKQKNEPYFLAVGSIHGRKNLKFLIQAYAELRQENRVHGKLIIVGRHLWGKQEWEEGLKQLGIHDDILFTGSIQDSTLAHYYANATALVFPSLYEGFGIPILEAQQLNCPVLAANRSALPEIGGNGALYFDLNDIDDLKLKMEDIEKNQILRDDLIEKGLKNARKYSWKKSVETLTQTLLAQTWP